MTAEQIAAIKELLNAIDGSTVWTDSRMTEEKSRRLERAYTVVDRMLAKKAAA